MGSVGAEHELIFSTHRYFLWSFLDHYGAHVSSEAQYSNHGRFFDGFDHHIPHDEDHYFTQLQILIPESMYQSVSGAIKSFKSYKTKLVSGPRVITRKMQKSLDESDTENKGGKKGDKAKREKKVHLLKSLLLRSETVKVLTLRLPRSESSRRWQCPKLLPQATVTTFL